MLKDKKITALVLIIILGSSLSLYSVQAVSRDTPDLTALIQKIYDGVNNNTGLIKALSDSIDAKCSDLRHLIIDKHGITDGLIQGVETKADQLQASIDALSQSVSNKHRTTDGLITEVGKNVTKLTKDELTYYTDIHSDLFYITEYVDEVEANQDAITENIDTVRSNQAGLLAEVNQNEIILGEIRMWQNTYNDYAHIDHQNLGVLISNVQTTTNEVASDTDTILTELAYIKQSLSTLQSNQGNVIMDSTILGASITEPGIIHVYDYGSKIKHVSVTLKLSMKQPGDTFSIYSRHAGQDFPIDDLFQSTPADVTRILHYEFDTKYWYIQTYNNDGLSLDTNFNMIITTFEEA